MVPRNAKLFGAMMLGMSFWVFGFGVPSVMATPAIWEASFGSELTDLTGEDDVETDVGLSFLFPFAGSTYTDISVSTNGLIGLGGGADPTCCPTEDDLFDEDQPTIAPFWSDMNLEDMGEVAFNEFGDRIRGQIFG